MKSKEKSVIVYPVRLTASVYERLKVLAAREHRSISKQIFHIVSLYLEQQGLFAPASPTSLEKEVP